MTHDRRRLLVESLAAVQAQTHPVDHLLVVDNASSDGTGQLLRTEFPEVEVLTLSSNQGGAGGFHAGVAHAHAAGFEWIWLMDDDTLPAPGCLEALLAAERRLRPASAALLSSKVVWIDGRLHPMNYPGFERTRTDRVVAASEVGIMPLRTATFVSLLVNRGAVERHGLPLRRYFLWSDDIEYTSRILRHEPGYLVPESVALHKTERPHTAITDSGDRFYFHVRNTLYMLRGSSWRTVEKPSLLFGLTVSVLEYLRVNRFSTGSIRVILRGLLDGCRPGAPTPARP